MKTTQPTYPAIAKLAEHLSLRSLSSRTRGEYLRYIGKLADHCGKDPATLQEHEARAYLLYLKEQKRYAPSSMRIATAALRFFYNEALGHGWRLFSIVRTPDKQTASGVESGRSAADLERAQRGTLPGNPATDLQLRIARG